MKKILFAYVILLASCMKGDELVSTPELIVDNCNLMPMAGPLPEELNWKPNPINGPNNAGSCIYFDFDGETVNHNSWNGGATFYCQPSTMTAEAKAQAMYRVQLAYAKYNVTVTDQLSVYNNARVKQRIIVTPTSAWYPHNNSGVAYIGTLFARHETPAFVFTDRLSENTKYIGDIMMHESGHTVGLSHQSLFESCNLVNNYRPGTIMGYPFNLPEAQWIYGTTNSCNSFQNDTLVLQQKLKLR